MAKLTLNNLNSGFASTATLNANFDAIEAALENTLSRNGATPNQMQADLDMNSNGILNLATLDVASLSINGTPVTADSIVAGEIPDQATHTGKFLQTNGTVTSWQEVLQREVPSVTDYGALGDGVTDDTAAIQAALDDIPSTGGTLLFPPGDYYITDTLTTGTKKAVRLVGLAGMNQPVETSGTRIITDQAIDMLVAGSASSTTPSGIQIENLSFIGGDTTTCGIKVLRQNMVRLKNVSVGLISTGKGIVLDGTGDSNTLNLIDGCFIRRCLVGIEARVTAALFIVGATYVTGNSRAVGSKGLDMITAETTNLQGFAVDNCEKAIVIDSNSDRTTSFGTRLEANAIGFDVSGGETIIIGGTHSGYDSSSIGVNINAAATNTKVLDCEYISSSTANRVVDAGSNTIRKDRFSDYDLSPVIHTIGTTVTTGASTGDVVLANTKYLRIVNAAGTSASPVIGLDSTNRTTIASPRARTADNQTLLLMQCANESGTLADVMQFVSSGATSNEIIPSFPTVKTVTTVGAAGGATALPATPTGYLRIKLNGTVVQIPYYAT